jgi:PAS domain S-box-containing protein
MRLDDGAMIGGGFFSRLRLFFVHRMAPAELLARDSLAFWRVNILATILMASAALCALALGAVLFLAIRLDSWHLLFFDLLVYALSISLLLVRGPSYETRAGFTSLLIYLIGLVVTIFMGPLSGGPLWLFGFTIFAGVFLGSKAALAAAIVNAITLVTLCALILTGKIAQGLPFFLTTEAMVAAVASFTVLNLLTGLSISVLVKGLGISHQKEKALSSTLDLERRHLVAAKQRLEVEIQERESAEAAVRESEQKYKLLAENVSDIIWMIDIKTLRMTYVSPSVERVRGYTPEEVMHQPLDQVLSPGSYEMVKQKFGDLLRRKETIQPRQTFTLEVEQFKKNGDKIHSEVTVSFIRDAKQRPVTVLGVTRDITERKRAEEARLKLENELRQAKKMEAIGTLAGGIAHDFNNILSSIIGFTELCLDDAPKDSLLRDNLNEIFTGGKRAKELVKQILAFARQADDQASPIQVGAIARETIKFLRSSIPRTIQIISDIQSDALIMGNATQVQQVIMNLFANAADAMEEGGVLSVSLNEVVFNDLLQLPVPDMRLGHYLKLVVQDTGAGIPPNVLPSIFDPYFTTKAVGKGTGMGLAVVHGIVESYGGRIVVESAPGMGTTFTLFLPATARQADAQEAEIENLPGGRERILFVDDEAAIAAMGCQLLERLGYAVVAQTSSLEALALFRAKPEDFDLVITDMTMPNLPGDKLIQALRAIRPDIPIILCTGYSAKVSEDNAPVLGAQGFAYKPIVRADIARLVRNVLDAARN